MPVDRENIIRILTAGSLAGLLMAVGFRITVGEVFESVRKCRWWLILPVNFIAVPVLVVTLARLLQLGPEITIGMILLAAAPFAPVVPVFARLARADLALAAGLTCLFPVVSAFATPFVCEMALRSVPGRTEILFHAGTVLTILLGTIVLPVGVGMLANHSAPRLVRRILRPIEVLSEAAGAVSLAFVTMAEFRSIIAVGMVPMLAMAASCELCLLLGYFSAGGTRHARRVVALGTANRNIALAILLALQSFPGTPVVAAVVANGLLLIFLGLVHVGLWRFGR